MKLGGIDADFLACADQAIVRKEVRENFKICMPGGGYYLGLKNSVPCWIKGGFFYERP